MKCSLSVPRVPSVTFALGTAPGAAPDLWGASRLSLFLRPQGRPGPHIAGPPWPELSTILVRSWGPVGREERPAVTLPLTAGQVAAPLCASAPLSVKKEGRGDLGEEDGVQL